MNILLLAVGTRNKIVQYFKRAWSGTGQVIATDSSILAPAIYEADRYYIVPPITAPDYLDVILDICKKEKITGQAGFTDYSTKMTNCSRLAWMFGEWQSMRITTTWVLIRKHMFSLLTTSV